MARSASTSTPTGTWQPVGDYPMPDEPIYVHPRELPALAKLKGYRSAEELPGLGKLYEELRDEGTLARLAHFPTIGRDRVTLPLSTARTARRTTRLDLQPEAAPASLAVSMLPPGSPARSLPPTARIPFSDSLILPCSKTIPAAQYVPANLDPQRCTMLVVILHGGQQDGRDYAEATGWTDLADHGRMVLLAPQQTFLRNVGLHFNFFDMNFMGKQEADAILDMISILKLQYLSLKRIFVTGLSSGGAMTAAMMAISPDFEAGAIIAGLPFLCANNVWEARDFMNNPRDLTPGEWREKVLSASPKTRSQWPRVSIWHSLNDGVVQYGNAVELLDQWTACNEVDEWPDIEEQISGQLHRVYSDAQGNPRVELYALANSEHGTPVDPGTQPDQGGDPGKCDFVYGGNIFSTYHIAKFWQIL